MEAYCNISCGEEICLRPIADYTSTLGMFTQRNAQSLFLVFGSTLTKMTFCHRMIS